MLKNFLKDLIKESIVGFLVKTVIILIITLSVGFFINIAVKKVKKPKAVIEKVITEENFNSAGEKAGEIANEAEKKFKSFKEGFNKSRIDTVKN